MVVDVGVVGVRAAVAGLGRRRWVAGTPTGREAGRRPRRRSARGPLPARRPGQSPARTGTRSAAWRWSSFHGGSVSYPDQVSSPWRGSRVSWAPPLRPSQPSGTARPVGLLDRHHRRPLDRVRVVVGRGGTAAPGRACRAAGRAGGRKRGRSASNRCRMSSRSSASAASSAPRSRTRSVGSRWDSSRRSSGSVTSSSSRLDHPGPFPERSSRRSSRGWRRPHPARSATAGGGKRDERARAGGRRRGVTPRAAPAPSPRGRRRSRPRTGG